MCRLLVTLTIFEPSLFPYWSTLPLLLFHWYAFISSFTHCPILIGPLAFPHWHVVHISISLVRCPTPFVQLPCLYWSIVPSPFPHWPTALLPIGSLTSFETSVDVLLWVLLLHWSVVLPSLVDFWFSCSCHSGFSGPQCDTKEYNVLYVVPGSGKVRYVLIASIIGALQVAIICVVVLCITRWACTHPHTSTHYKAMSS